MRVQRGSPPVGSGERCAHPAFFPTFESSTSGMLRYRAGREWASRQRLLTAPYAASWLVRAGGSHDSVTAVATHALCSSGDSAPGTKTAPGCPSMAYVVRAPAGEDVDASVDTRDAGPRVASRANSTVSRTSARSTGRVTSLPPLRRPFACVRTICSRWSLYRFSARRNAVRPSPSAPSAYMPMAAVPRDRSSESSTVN